MANKKKKKKGQSAHNSKPKTAPVAAENIEAEQQEQPASDIKEANKTAKPVVADKKPVAKKVNKNKKPNIFVRLGRKIKEVFSELKKVTWPTFPTVVRQTGVVLVVVAFFLVFIFLIDWGFSALFELQFPSALGS